MGLFLSGIDHYAAFPLSGIPVPLDIQDGSRSISVSIHRIKVLGVPANTDLNVLSPLPLLLHFRMSRGWNLPHPDFLSISYH